MTQPGVYFTLDAPFVRIIGLFSNALEDPGVISSEKGKWANVPDTQLDYLAAQLARIKKENHSGAVLLALHHPPFSYAPPPGNLRNWRQPRRQSEHASPDRRDLQGAGRLSPVDKAHLVLARVRHSCNHVSDMVTVELVVREMRQLNRFESAGTQALG